MTTNDATVEKANESSDIEGVIGTHEYAGRLYSPQKAADVMNINLITGEQTHDIPPAKAVEQWIADKNEESRQKANNTEWHTHTPSVALVAANGEQLYESGALVSRAAFFHFDITGDLDTHKQYNAAYKSDEYDVEYATDYEQGTITITVECAAQRGAADTEEI
jgi:hypothetical protein